MERHRSTCQLLHTDLTLLEGGQEFFFSWKLKVLFIVGVREHRSLSSLGRVACASHSLDANHVDLHKKFCVNDIMTVVDNRLPFCIFLTDFFNSNSLQNEQLATRKSLKFCSD